MKKIIITIFILTFTGVSLLEAEDPSFKIIINKSNTVSSLTKKEISRLFLKKNTRWDNGHKVLPADQKADSSVRESFSKAIHGKGVSAIKSYWQRMIFSGRAIPPPEKSSDKEVLTYVMENTDAIGYVSASTKLDEVKIQQITVE